MAFVKERHYFKNRVNANDVPADISIGDITGTKFIPRVDMSKWNGEAWMMLSYPQAVGSELATYDPVNDRITLTVGNYIFRWYLHPDESLEYEIILAKRPTGGVNSFTLNLDFPAGMEFYYQPALTPEEIALNYHRPENVVGSYAIYWAKKNNEYKTGKFIHWYAPTLTDALGNSIYGTLLIDPIGKTATIGAPSAWLRDAAYPVTIGPNLGYSSSGASSWGDATYMQGGIGTTDATGGTTDQIHGYWNVTTGHHNVKVCIYASSGGAPTSQLLTEVSSDVFGDTKTDINYVVSLAASTTYFVAYMPDSSDVALRYDSGGGVSDHAYRQPGSWDLPDPFGAATYNSSRLSLWASYAAPSAAGAPNVHLQRGAVMSTGTNYSFGSIQKSDLCCNLNRYKNRED